jgi:hypothetical protein
MITALNIPEITISPIDLCSDRPEYTWKMKAYEESLMDSYDHGDVFTSVEEALADAYAVYFDLSNGRHLVPARQEQEFKVTIRQDIVPEDVVTQPVRSLRLV